MSKKSSTFAVAKVTSNMKRFILFLTAGCCLWLLSACQSPASQEPQGEIVITPGQVFTHTIQSKFVGERTIRVYVPASFETGGETYDVLYMQDGQMLFDATTTWNHQEWGVDEAMDSLQALGYIRPTIVVGIDAAGTASAADRIAEYCPDDVANYLPEGHAMYSGLITPKGNDYLRFLVEEVKPFIEMEYPQVYREREHTWIMGSSCGALISSYAVNKYPDVFAGAACLSTHSTLSVDADFDYYVVQAYVKYITKTRPVNTYKIYFDRGDQTLDANYADTQEFINGGYTGDGWCEPSFMYQFFPGAAHTEDDWRARLPIPLIFLLGK